MSNNYTYLLSRIGSEIALGDGVTVSTRRRLWINPSLASPGTLNNNFAINAAITLSDTLGTNDALFIDNLSGDLVVSGLATTQVTGANAWLMNNTSQSIVTIGRILLPNNPISSAAAGSYAAETFAVEFFQRVWTQRDIAAFCTAKGTTFTQPLQLGFYFNLASSLGTAITHGVDVFLTYRIVSGITEL